MDRNTFSKSPLGGPSGASDPDPSGESPPPVFIPDHKLLRCIGRGSYGEVWLARNMTGMYRAVKIVYRNSFDTQRPFDRELSGIQKFEPVSRSHEGFVDVLHVGIKEGEYFYYVMELGDDQTSGQNINPENYSPKTLAQGISLQGKLPFRECLKLGLALSLALAELHKHGLVHRDVKPSNIIFVNGVPKLADIGLVANAGEARSYVGTEGFIPPEGPGAPNADVYGLGKVLYECSTGKDRHDFPELPTLLDEFPEYEKLVELNEIILHACKTEAKDRYQTAWEMHSDLLVLANGKSVKRLKFLERRLATFKKMAGVSAAVVIVGAAILFQINRERQVSIEARQRQIGADVANGNNAIAAGDSLGALPYFARALSLNENPANQSVDRMRFALTLAQCPALVQMCFVSNSIFNADFHPDGRHILISEWQGRAQIFDIQTGRPVSPQFGQAELLRSGTFSADGALVVTASEDKTARVWKAADGTELFRLEHPDKVLCANFSPDGKHIITGCLDGIARVWSSSSKELEYSLTGHTDSIMFATYSHNGQMIVTASRDGTARIWSAATGRQIGVPLEHSTWVHCAAFSPDDRELATACFDHKARVWELASSRLILPEMTHNDGVNAVQFSPDGRFIVTAGLDHTARLWYAADHRPVEVNPILWHGDRVTYAGFAPDGHQLVTTSTDGIARVWDLAGSEVAPAPLKRIFSEDGRLYATAGDPGIQIWDAATSQPLAPPFNPGFPVQDLKFSADGNSVLAVAVPDGLRTAVAMFEAATGRSIATPFFIASTFTNFCLSPDGQRLLTLGGNQFQTWNTLSGTPLSPPIAHESERALAAVFSPDGRKLALWGDDWAEIHNAATGQNFFPGLKHEALVWRVEFSRDGSRFLTCCADKTYTRCSARVWDVATGHALGSPMQHADGVLSASFSPDGSRVVTASEDYSASIWNLKTGRQVCPPLRHKDFVRSAVFSPDGKWVATASADTTARIWSAETGEALSPPLRHVAKLDNVKFLPDGKHLLTSNKSGESWVWKLPEEDKSMNDLQKLSCLLTGGAVAPAGTARTVGVDALKPLWEELRTNYPVHFTVAPSQVTAWNEFEAEQGEVEKQWYATAFHSQQILATAASDPRVSARLERAKNHLLERGLSKPDQNGK